MTDLHDLQMRLRGDLLQIHTIWGEVRKQWNDAVAYSFHMEHLQPNERVLGEYLRALQNMEKILDRAERDAEDNY